jgi:hypothetical protein
MQTLAQLQTSPEFKAVSVTWKGNELWFWCKVLSAKEHRQVTDYFGKDGQLDLNKYREMTDAFIAQCVYLEKTEMPDTKRTVVNFTDEDGEAHELVQWVTKAEAGELKASLADRIKRQIETVNSLKVDDDLEKK